MCQFYNLLTFNIFYSSLSNYTCQPYIGECEVEVEQVFPQTCRNFIYVLAVIHLLKEVCIRKITLEFVRKLTFSVYLILELFLFKYTNVNGSAKHTI